MIVYRVSGKHSKRLEVIEQSGDALGNKERVIPSHGAVILARAEKREVQDVYSKSPWRGFFLGGANCL